MSTRRGVVAGAAALLAGCSTLRVPGAAPAGEGAWAAVLRERVDGLGRVDFAGLARAPAALDAYVAHIAATPWDGFTDPAERLAYMINAYNALAMWGIVQRGIPARLSLLDRVAFFKLTRMVIGGRAISLYDYENDVIRPIGEARVHFALNCMAVSCPRLPQEPFTGARLGGQLEAAARLFFGEPRNLAVDPAAGTMTVSAILEFYTADFLRHAPSLAAYVSRHHTPAVPPGLRTVFYQYDWTVNAQPDSRA